MVAAMPTKVSDLVDDSGHYTKPVSGIPAADLEETYLTAHQDISGKADKTDTVLETTLSRGRKDNTTVGNGSFAFGYNTEASGNYSHAEGRNTSASGINSHAEGSGVIASGSQAHAEGTNTTAVGSASHAEGSNTIAAAPRSHAEGSFTVAGSDSQHV